MIRRLLLFIFTITIAVHASASIKMYYYDAEGDRVSKSEDASYLLIVDYTANPNVKNHFELYSGQTIIRAGSIYYVDENKLNECIFGDYLGFSVSGNISITQKDYGAYKLVAHYNENGNLQQCDSIITDKNEAFSWSISDDGSINTFVKYKNGEYSTPYYTIISNDRTVCCNLTHEDDKLYNEAVCYTEAKRNGNHQLTYLANGLQLTVGLDDSEDNEYYSLQLRATNNSISEIIIDPSGITAWGSNSKDIKKLIIPAANEIEKPLFANYDNYISLYSIQPQNTYKAFFKVKKGNSKWLAILVRINGVSYPFYFPLNFKIDSSTINWLVNEVNPQAGLLNNANSKSANKLLTKRNAGFQFNKTRYENLAAVVYKDYEAETKKYLSSKLKNSFSFIKQQSPYSQQFINNANMATSCINKLLKTTNRTEVYNICLKYYQAYYQMKRSKKNKDEQTLFENIYTKFESVSESISTKLKCSGEVLKAHLEVAGKNNRK